MRKPRRPARRRSARRRCRLSVRWRLESPESPRCRRSQQPPGWLLLGLTENDGRSPRPISGHSGGGAISNKMRRAPGLRDCTNGADAEKGRNKSGEPARSLTKIKHSNFEIQRTGRLLAGELCKFMGIFPLGLGNNYQYWAISSNLFRRISVLTCTADARKCGGSQLMGAD